MNIEKEEKKVEAGPPVKMSLGQMLIADVKKDLQKTEKQAPKIVVKDSRSSSEESSESAQEQLRRHISSSISSYSLEQAYKEAGVSTPKNASQVPTPKPLASLSSSSSHTPL